MKISFFVLIMYNAITFTIFIWYLMGNGYLGAYTPKITSKEDDEGFYATSLDKKMTTEVRSKLISHYQRKYAVRDDILLNAATSLLQFTDNEDYGVSQLEGCLGKLYNGSWTRLVSNNNTKNYISDEVEDPFQALFTCVVLKMQHTNVHKMEVFCPHDMNSSYVIFSSHSNQLILARINHNDQSIESTLSSMKNHEYSMLENYNCTKPMRMVAVKIWPNKTVQVYIKIQHRM